jgi:long-chain acyl-CoA synthetase
MGAAVDEKMIAQVYTVRELVDAVLQSRGDASAPAPRASLPGWDSVLAVEPDDPKVFAALNSNSLFTFVWFLFGKVVAVILRIFFNMRVTGKEKLPKHGPFILSPNHQSFLDGPAVASQIPWRLFKNMFYVGTSEIFGHGAFHYLGRTFKLVPVDPDSNLVNAMRAGAYGLRKGHNLVLYPEGERSIDGVPKKFKKGAAILAAHLQVPIYPVALEGFFDSWPRSRRFPRLAKLRVHFGDPILPPETVGNPEETYKQLTEELRNRVVEMWDELRQKSANAKAAAAGD